MSRALGGMIAQTVWRVGSIWLLAIQPRSPADKIPEFCGNRLVGYAELLSNR